jgi:hypothetical protein
MSNPRFESPECVVSITPSQNDLFMLEIDDPRNKWLEANEPPLPGNYVDLILEDDTTTSGFWDGTKWVGLRFGDSHPVKWRPQRGLSDLGSPRRT